MTIAWNEWTPFLSQLRSFYVLNGRILLLICNESMRLFQAGCGYQIISRTVRDINELKIAAVLCTVVFLCYFLALAVTVREWLYGSVVIWLCVCVRVCFPILH